VNLNDNIDIDSCHSASDSEVELSGIGGRLRSIRGGRPQIEYAKQLKIGISTLRRYESNTRQPDASVLNAIYKLDGVLSDWILRGEGSMRRDTLQSIQQPINIELLSMIMDLVEDAIEQADLEMDSINKVLLFIALYNTYSNSKEKLKKPNVINFVNALARKNSHD